jgi:hypothetical protein
MPETPPGIGRLARWTRALLIAGIAIVGMLILSSSRSDFPLTMSRAHADILGASPGYLLTTLVPGANDKLYLLDRDQGIVCVYNVNGNKLRLISARRFETDVKIPDGSKQYGNLRIEGNPNGLGIEEAKQYYEQWKKEHPKDW